METQADYKPQLSIEEFKRSRNRIMCGNVEELPRLQEIYMLSLEQFTTLSELHEKALKEGK